MTDKAREEFEAAFLEEMVSRLGEGFRSSAQMFFVEKEPDGGYSNPIPHAAWWAWQASRAALVIDLPSDQCIDLHGYSPKATKLYCRKAIEAAGLKVKP